MTISLLLLLGASALGLLAGGFPRRTAASQVLGSIPAAVLSGAVLLHWGLSALQLATVRWSVVPVVLFALLASRVWIRKPLERPGARLRRPGWGLVAGMVPIAFFGFVSTFHLAHTADFVYHWGLKAARWVTFGGIDASFLDRPGAWRMHPDYPQLVTELMALPGILAGRFDERAALLQTAALAALTLLAFRFCLRSRGLRGFELEAASMGCGAAVGGFGFIYGMAGGADAALAFALLTGVIALVAPAGPEADAALAWSAAFAAASKIEGMPLAFLLLAAGLFRERGGASWRRLAVLTAPALLVVLPWYLSNQHRFLATNAGSPRWSEVPEILVRLGGVALRPEGGFWPLLVLLLPVLTRKPHLKLAALVIAGQLVVYVALYVVSPVGLEALITASGLRLLSHLVPATLLLTVLAASMPQQAQVVPSLGPGPRNGELSAGVTGSDRAVVYEEHSARS